MDLGARLASHFIQQAHTSKDSMRGKQPKGKTSTARQLRITESALPLLKKPLDQLGKHIGVPGSYWELGRMGEQEKTAIYKCTIREYDALHKWGQGGMPPSQAFQLQEMGKEGAQAA